MTSPNWTAAPDFSTAFGLQYLASKGTDTWDESKFHLSDATKCHRSLWYRMMRATNPEFSAALPEATRSVQEQMNLDIGHAVHGLIQDSLVRMGLCTPEDIEVPVCDTEINLKGSVDAILSMDAVLQMLEHVTIQLVYKDSGTVSDLPTSRLGEKLRARGGTHVILDIKTKKDQEEVTRKPNRDKIVTHTFPDKIMQYPEEAYSTQVQCYAHLAEENYPTRYPIIRDMIILYFCKNNGGLFAVYLERDDDAYAAVKAKGVRLQRAMETQVPPPQDYTRSNGKCRGWLENGVYRYGCPHYAYCYPDAD